MKRLVSHLQLRVALLQDRREELSSALSILQQDSPPTGKRVLLLVQCADGSEYQMVVDVEIVVSELKNRIGALTGVGAWQQQVFIDQSVWLEDEEKEEDGGQLSDEKTLSECIDIANLQISEGNVEVVHVLNTEPILAFMLVI